VSLPYISGTLVQILPTGQLIAAFSALSLIQSP
jgi:hypothetical protein